MDNICAIILAAGKGTRMNSTDQNKVSIEIGGKPIIQRIIEILKNAGVKDILVVVGFAKESVTKLLYPEIIVVDQGEPLGTGHAVKQALAKVPEADQNILVVYGDDGFWFTPEILNDLYKKHIDSQADITFCTTTINNPTGLGRIIREKGEVVDIIEEKAATDKQKLITEVNLGGYIFKKSFIENHINNLAPNPANGEYYLTDIIPLSAQIGANIQTLTLDNFTWRGINTPQELTEAEKLIK